MDELISNVQSLAEQEYERASELFGAVHNSEHEAFAVLLEEIEEASQEIGTATSALYELWNLIKSKASTEPEKLDLLAAIRARAVLAACESIQVAAMAHKFICTLEKGGAN